MTSTRFTSPSRRREEFNRRNSNASVEEGRSQGERILELAQLLTASARRPRSASRSAAPSRAPSTRVVLPGLPNGSPARARPRSCWRTRSESACRARSRNLVGRVAPLGVPIGVHLHNTRNIGFRERLRRARGRGDGVRRLGRRDRWLPVRPPGHGEHRDRGPRLPLPRRGRRDGHRPRRADQRRGVARIARSGASSRVRSTRPAPSRRLPAEARPADLVSLGLG